MPLMRASDLGRWASLVVPTLVSLAASATLLVDYTRPIPLFCAPGGGCDAVKRTAFAYVLHIPTPAFGVAMFLALGVLSLLRGPKVRMVQLVLAIAAAFVSLGLLAVQLKIGHFCPYCVVSDVSALVLVLAVASRQSTAWDPPEGRLALVPSFLLTAAVVVPAALPLVVKPKAPQLIVDENAKSPRGVVTIVDFVDFECPWCRENHKALAPLVEEHKSQVRVVRKQVPLMGIHPHAWDAALAAVCGENMGKGDAIAEALFSVEVSNLTTDGCEKIAAAAGLDLAAFRTCVKDPATAARVIIEKEAFKSIGGRGLPLLFIGPKRIDGANDRPILEAALLEAMH